MAESLTTLESSPATRFVKYWLPVLAMLGVIYFFSTDTFSGDNTRSLLERIILWLLPGISEETLTAVNFRVRKAAHFIEYAALAALLFRAFRADSPIRYRLRWALYSFAFVVVWALLDEYHQTFTKSRGGSIRDSMIDSAGGLAALLIISYFNRRGGR